MTDPVGDEARRRVERPSQVRLDERTYAEPCLRRGVGWGLLLGREARMKLWGLNEAPSPEPPATDQEQAPAQATA